MQREIVGGCIEPLNEVWWHEDHISFLQSEAGRLLGVISKCVGDWQCRQPEGAGMAARITAMVNEVVSQEEPGSQPLSEADVLGLIDTGGSEGGSQVRPP